MTEDNIKDLKSENRFLRDQINSIQLRFENKIAELSMIRELGTALFHFKSFELTCQLILDVIIKETVVQNCSIMLLDRERDRLFLLCATDPEKNYYILKSDKIFTKKGLRYTFKLGEGVAGQVLMKGDSLLVQDTSESSIFILGEKKRIPVGSLLCVPLFLADHPFGVLNLSHQDSGKFEMADVHLFEILASFIALAIHSSINHEKLKKSEQRYRLLAENMSDTLWTLDLKTMGFSFVGPSVKKNRGFTPEEAIQMSLKETFHPESYERMIHILREELALEEEGPIDPYKSRMLEVRQLCRDGTYSWAEVTLSLLRNEGGKPAEILGVTRDISERKRAEKLNEAKLLAEASNRAKSEFLSNMSHELRTPLNHIIGFTELIVEKQFGELNEAQDEYLNDVLQSSRHLLSLINDILDLSKVEAGKMELELEDVHLEGLLEGSQTIIKEKTLKHGIEMSTDLDGLPEYIRADERKLRQILYNLLSNAVKFTPDGGRVLLKARQTAPSDPAVQNLPNSGRQYVQVSIEDNGTGLKKKDLGKIFQPFEQAKNTEDLKNKGTGLGLALTKKLVELHGGRIWVTSDGEGKGCTFSFVIPVDQQER